MEKDLASFPRYGAKEGAKATSSSGEATFCGATDLKGKNREPPYNPEIETAILGAMDVVQPRNAVELADAINELV